MGHDPADYDVATSATPTQVRELFGRRRTLPVGMSFGVIIVLGRHKSAGQIEVATFRTDANYSDGRHPDHVTFSTEQEDARRRDFTINGMFYDPIAERVIDYVGGQDDLQRGVIRAIGCAEDRLAEDKLRMLRAVRFAARFGFEIEDSTRRAVKNNAAGVAQVSGERVAAELQKMLSAQRAFWSMQECFELRLLEVVLPAVAESWPQVSENIRSMFTEITEADWKTKLTVLLACSHAAEHVDASVAELKSRFKLSNNDTEAIRFALAVQKVLREAQCLPWSQLQPWLVHEHMGTALALYQATCSVGGNPQTLHWLREKLQLPADELNPPPWLLGKDLIALGVKPSPRFKEILKRARELQLDKQLPNREAALAWASAAVLKENAS